MVQVPNAEPALWAKALESVDYPTHPTQSFSETFGKPPAKLAFADAEHLALTFITSDPAQTPEQKGRPDSFKLRLHVVIFNSNTGEVVTKKDWPTPNPNDGVVTGNDGTVVIRTGDKLKLCDTKLADLKEITTTDQGPNHRIFHIFSSPRGRSLLIEFSPGATTEYTWIAAKTLETLRSFSTDLHVWSLSDTAIVGSRRNSALRTEVVIRKFDDSERILDLPNYRSNKLAFVGEDAIAVESGYSPMLLVRTDGTTIKSIAPPEHDHYSRVIPSAEASRFAFTASRIRNNSELLNPHQTWEYVRRVEVYDVSTYAFVGEFTVKQSERNEDFTFALSPNGSMVAFIDGNSLKAFRVPPADQ